MSIGLWKTTIPIFAPFHITWMREAKSHRMVRILDRDRVESRHRRDPKVPKFLLPAFEAIICIWMNEWLQYIQFEYKASFQR